MFVLLVVFFLQIVDNVKMYQTTLMQAGHGNEKFAHYKSEQNSIDVMA